MIENPYAASLETRIFSATPMELVKILYQAAIEAVQTARQHLDRGEIFERGRSVSKAVAILGELNSSLDHQKGGEVSDHLAAMYDFLQRTLLDANFRQSDAGLETAETLLKTLNDAWVGITIERTGVSNAYSGYYEAQPAMAAYNPVGHTGVFEDCATRASNQWTA